MKLVLAALVLFAASLPAAAQWLDHPWPNIPRTADGEPDLNAPTPRGAHGRPDLSGVWDASPPLVRLDEATLQPWVVDLIRQRQDEFYKSRPFYQCRPSGPESQQYGGWKRFIHSPAVLAILSENLTYRVIHLDGRELEADPLPSWMGYAVGRWDGDTLVVESNGYNDKTWVSRFGVSHTEALRITERYRRPDFGHLEIEVTMTDPGAFTKPWGFTVEMELGADTDMLEAVCETGTEAWGGSLSEAAEQAPTVPPEVLARYVGAYTGRYAGSERTYEVTLVDGELFATIVGENNGVGLAAAGLDENAPRPLVPQSDTLFEGLGLGYRFLVNGAGEVTDLVLIHVSGDYYYARHR